MNKTGIRHQASGISFLKRWFTAGAWRLRAGALKGFTLIEMIVAVAIFMFVMIVAVGSLVSIIAADRKAQSIQAVADNLQFALDDMSRIVRTGTRYNCTTANGGDCSLGDCAINVIDQSGKLNVTYEFAQLPTPPCNGGPSCGSANFVGGCLLRRITGGIGGGGGWLALTSPDISIDAGRFYVSGSSQTDTAQPRILMTLSGHISQGVSTPTYLYLQTMLTQRIYDEPRL
jgi:Tfp pilus assembly protein PilE